MGSYRAVMGWVIVVGVMLAVAAFVLGSVRDANLAKQIGREVRRRTDDGDQQDG
jgi:VIT1/CCC1 family predicted Fe2+/Mn2+ transporter